MAELCTNAQQTSEECEKREEKSPMTTCTGISCAAIKIIKKLA